MHPLALRIRLGDQRPRFAQPEAHLPEQILALAHPQCNSEAAFDPRAERLAVPKIAAQTALLRTAAQRDIDLLELPFTQSTGPARPLAFQQAGQSILFESVHPILHCSGRVPEESGDFKSAHSLSHQ